MYGIFTYLYQKSTINVGKQKSYMDGMGRYGYICTKLTTSQALEATVGNPNDS